MPGGSSGEKNFRKALRLAFAESAEIGRGRFSMATTLSTGTASVRGAARSLLDHIPLFFATRMLVVGEKLLTDRSSTLPPVSRSRSATNLDPCRGMVPLTDKRFGQQEVGGRFLAVLLQIVPEKPTSDEI